ncbi:MAG TPA: hypothetical protein VEW45_08770 [Candidatus Dormibacteraeota bacterium]|nr:hypothetical protein [Candidatus Dormibacteraeota bacterium]
MINSTGEVDTYALRWHAFLWDLWFLIWGLALAAAGLRARQRHASLAA